MGRMTDESPRRLSWLQRLVLRARARPIRTIVIILVVSLGGWGLFVYLYESERDRVIQTLEIVRDGIVEQDVEKVLSRVSPYFSEGGVDKERLRQTLRSILRRDLFDRVYLISRDVEVGDGIAQVEARVVSVHYGRPIPSEWVIALEKIEGKWYVRRARPISVRKREVAGLRSVLTMGPRR